MIKSPHLILLNNYTGKHSLIINILIVILKQYIYATKCHGNKTLDFNEFMSKVSHRYLLDKHIAYKNQRIKQFYKKWGKWFKCFHSQCEM